MPRGRNKALIARRDEMLPYCFINIIIGHVGACCDSDVLFFACSQVFCRYIYDTVGINIKSYFDLRNTSSCWRDTIQTELSKRFVVFRKLSLSADVS